MIQTLCDICEENLHRNKVQFDDGLYYEIKLKKLRRVLDNSDGFSVGILRSKLDICNVCWRHLTLLLCDEHQMWKVRQRNLSLQEVPTSPKEPFPSERADQ